MEKQYRIADGRFIEAIEEPGPIKVFVMPDGAEKTRLIDFYKLDEHTLNSALDPEEISRLELEPEHIAVILKRPRNYSSEDNLLYRITSIGIFLFKDKIIVIMSEDVSLLEGKQTMKLYSLHDVFLRIISAIIGHFLAHLRVINMLSESIEQKINASMGNKYLLNMFTLEKSLVYYLNGISSNVAVIDKIKYHSPKIGMSQENLEMLDDIIIENAQCMKQAEVYSNILTGLMDARGSIVNNNQNVLIRRLTLISVVFLPLNLIAGIGGMSEFTMMTLGIPWPISYSLFSVALTILGFVMYFAIRRMGFEKKPKERRGRLFSKRKLPDM
jgi:magnesium transporter